MITDVFRQDCEKVSVIMEPSWAGRSAAEPGGAEHPLSRAESGLAEVAGEHAGGGDRHHDQAHLGRAC